MHRRALALPTLLIAALVAIAACGPAAPIIEDPVEILTKAVEATSNAKTVHLEASVDGSVNLDLMGTGEGGALTLAGTKLVGDIDFEEGDLQAHVEVPAMLGFTADLVVVGQDAFVRSSMSGALFQHMPMADAGIPVGVGDVASQLDEFTDWLSKPELSPEKLDDADCHGERCYQVGIELTPEEILSLGGELGAVPMAGALAIRVLVEKDSLRLAGISVQAQAADMGDMTVSLLFSKWDEGLDIAAPPPNEVQ